ncbi:MAG: hypothetical protein JW717_02845 [Marinilabiliaceae bacterium]|nr:hypothetical protein [Marinilabiliaceae bacterium]
MKPIKSSVFIIVTLAFWGIQFISCEKDVQDNQTPTISQFVSLENPYMICANRNPGGVGFDFEYNNKKGGANNIDSLTVDDFAYDLKIRTIKAEKPDGSLGGVPFIQLHETVNAVNYSSVDTTCKGFTDFQNLTSSNIQNYTLQSDNSSFNLASVPVGTTGSPLMQDLNQELNKLVIGQRWKNAAGNTIAADEPIWIIQTREGRIIKFIVTVFPAAPAPTSTGYIAIEWDFVE